MLGDDEEGLTCAAARADAALLRVVELTHYTEEMLERTSAEFIARLMRAKAGDNEAQRIQQERDMAAAKNRPG